MKRFLASGLTAMVVLGACGGGGGGTKPLVFTADLKSTNSVPPITDAEASCTGKGTFTLDTTANTAKAEFTVAGCPSSTEIILSHIHQGAAGQNGPVKVDFALKPSDLTSGGTAFSKSNITVDPAVAKDIVASPAGWYFNVHSKAHGGGVVRAQLVKQ